MKRVPAFAVDYMMYQRPTEGEMRGWRPELTQRTIVPRIFACRACTIKLYSTDATDVVLGLVPSPGSYRIPLPDGHLHGVVFCSQNLLISF